jgi:D-alanyl-D-alanine carboxypeptidase
VPERRGTNPDAEHEPQRPRFLNPADRTRFLSPAKSVVCTALFLVAAAAHAQPGESIASDAALARRLAHALDSLSAAGAFSGTVLLAHHDLPIFEHAYGIADRAHGTPNTVETAYNLASVGKLFTGTAIEQLARAGRLDTGATIDRYWPEYPNRELARKATVAQLLAMSSGIRGDIFGTPATAHSLRTIPDYLRQFVNDPLDFEPGTKRAYSNAGYVVLGALVERVSGEEYRRYLQQHVFAPGRMTHTGFLDSDSLPPWAAIGYTSGDPAVHGGPLQANTPMLPGRGSPAAGSYSTVGDLLRYVHAQRTGAIAGTSGTPKVGRAVPLAPTPSSSRTCPGTTP